MVTVNEFVEHIRGLIENNQIKKAINGMKLYFHKVDNGIHSKMFLYSASFKQNEDSYLQGLNEDSNNAKIILSLLNILVDLEEESGEKEIPRDKLIIIKEKMQWDIELDTPISIVPQENTSTLTKEEKENEESHQLFAIYRQQQAELSPSSSREEREEFLKTARKLGEILNKSKMELYNLPEMKGSFASDIANLIYKTEELDDTLIQDVRKILSPSGKYQWYEKSLIVSALSLSAILIQKSYIQKIELLLESINAFEDNVWQKALVGMVFALNINPNRFSRNKSILEKRLNELQQRKHIQNALTVIDYILINKVYESVLFPSNLFKTPFFKDNPLNCFLPFYEKNEILENALDNASSEIDITEFEKYILNVPLLDSLKYNLSFDLEKNNVRLVKVDKTKKEDILYLDAINTADNLNPFYNIIAEYYVFYQHYNHQSIENIFGKELSISKTELNKIIYSRISKLKAEIYSLLNQKDYKSCIHRLKQILEIEPKNKWALNLIADSYVALGGHKEALSYRKIIEKEYPKDYKNLYLIANLLDDINKYEEALIYFDKVIELKPNYVDNLIDKVVCLGNLKQYEKAFLLCEEIEKDYPKNIRNLLKKSIICLILKQYQNTLNICLKILEIEPENVEGLWRITNVYIQLNNINNALFYIEKAYKLDNKNAIVLMYLGRTYWVAQKDLEQAKEYVLQSLQIEKRNVIYGNLGHITLCQGYKTEAIYFYKKCVKMYKDIEEFKENFNDDIQYITKYDISVAEYEAIRDELVAYWHSTPKDKSKGGGFGNKKR